MTEITIELDNFTTFDVAQYEYIIKTGTYAFHKP